MVIQNVPALHGRIGAIFLWIQRFTVIYGMITANKVVRLTKRSFSKHTNRGSSEFQYLQIPVRETLFIVFGQVLDRSLSSARLFLQRNVPRQRANDHNLTSARMSGWHCE